MKPVCIAGGVFTPRLMPTLITLGLFAVLIFLGTWQLQRLTWKENLLAAIDRRSHEPPLLLTPADIAQPNPDLEYRHAIAEGHFIPEHELYLSAISIDGKGGYHVLTTLNLKQGGTLLVDRGWIPFDHRPKPGESASYDRPTGAVTVDGILRLPQKPGFFAPTNHPETNDWYSYDLEAMAKALNISTVPPLILALDAEPNSTSYPIGGQTRVNLPNDHLGYAITWYSLALTLLIIYGVASWKREGQS